VFLHFEVRPERGKPAHRKAHLEGVFHKIQNTGRNPERLLNKTIEGFATHIAAKIASHTLRTLLRCQHGIDVLTFRAVSI